MSGLKDNEVSPQMQEYIKNRKPGAKDTLVIPEGVSPDMKQYLEDNHNKKQRSK
jgi:hypothetical protein